MAMNILDTPQEMAKYMTDNAILQEFLLQMLQISDEKKRAAFELKFWNKVKKLSPEIQAEVNAAHSKLAQRVYDRMGSILQTLSKEGVIQSNWPPQYFEQKRILNSLIFQSS